MEIEYRVETVVIGNIESTLNVLAKEGWQLHTIITCPGIGGEPTTYSLIMEGARAEEPEPEHRPMQMKGYVHT